MGCVVGAVSLAGVTVWLSLLLGMFFSRKSAWGVGVLRIAAGVAVDCNEYIFTPLSYYCGVYLGGIPKSIVIKYVIEHSLLKLCGAGNVSGLASSICLLNHSRLSIPLVR